MCVCARATRGRSEHHAPVDNGNNSNAATAVSILTSTHIVSFSFFFGKYKIIKTWNNCYTFLVNASLTDYVTA